MKPFNKKIVLENGQEFYGYGFGADKAAINEIVFNTSMVGYQEIISDPSYTDQMVCMTYPLIGNYGITDEDFETRVPTMGGLIVREYNDLPSNFRYTKTLSEVLDEYDIPGISGVDTRMITRIIRDEGSQKVMICDADMPYEEALKTVREYVIPTDMVSRVSCKKRWYSRTPNHKYDVVAIDCGIKHNIIRKLNEKGCNVTIVPYNITAEEILNMRPDGLFLSNGPGNPEDVQEVINVVRELKGKLPIFGICLGHQMISLALGAKTFKMKFGHRGGNHPVMNMKTGKIEITSQNHSYAVDVNSLEGTSLKLTHSNLLDDTAEGVESAEMISLALGAKTFKMKFGHRGGNHPVMNMKTGKIEITSQNHSYAVDVNSLEGTSLKLTHSNLLDDTAEGVESAENKLFSVQYHPESAPGPQDSAYLFDEFIALMEKEVSHNA
ncbi:MAG: glutamine-hydrolyzing carbamoyl-phosphate synthase small subunit [Eubacterium sp.]|nr:glutamine-hydrolyzing carbamoyl-phosphate synthase small subunit [Eubacterium sp.]